MGNPHEAGLLESNRKLLSTGEYYDLTIKCGGRNWRVHRSIICKRSEFFATACNKLHKESASKEIELEDDDPRVFERLLHYLYLLHYQDDIPYDLDEDSNSNASGNLTEPAKAGLNLKDRAVQNSANETFSQLMTNAQVYAMAEKFHIPDLKLLAQEKFLQHAHGWPIPGLAAVVHEVLTSTPQSDRGLRTVVRDIVSLHVAEITLVLRNADSEQYSVQTPESLQWVSVLRQEGEFLFEVLGQVTSHNAKQINNQHRVDAVPIGNLQHYQDEVKRLELENKALRCGQDEARRSEREDKAPRLDQDEVKRLERENQVLRSAKGHAIRTIRSEKDSEIKAIRFEKNNELKAIRFEKKNSLKRGGRLVAAINDYEYCRHCSEVFQPRVVGITTLDDWVDKGILQCKRCHTEQDWA